MQNGQAILEAARLLTAIVEASQAPSDERAKADTLRAVLCDENGRALTFDELGDRFAKVGALIDAAKLVAELLVTTGAKQLEEGAGRMPLHLDALAPRPSRHVS